MRFALLGDHPDGLAMARALVESGRHELALYAGPGAGVEYLRRWDLAPPRVADLEEALAEPGLGAVIVAGSPANRAALLQGRCAVLEKALRRDDLSVSERRRAKNSLAANRRAVLLVEAHEAILNGAPNGRSRALALAAGASVPLRTRLRALGAAAAPRLAARALAREQQRLGVPGPAGLRLPP